MMLQNSQPSSFQVPDSVSGFQHSRFKKMYDLITFMDLSAYEASTITQVNYMLMKQYDFISRLACYKYK